MTKLTTRIVRRLKSEFDTQRIRLGTRLASGTEFDYWALRDSLRVPKTMDEEGQAKYFAKGGLQLGYLQSIGLRPHHRFLDYGCAILRTAEFVVPFLEPYRYVGADVSRYAMAQGVQRLAAKGIPRDHYQLVNVRSPELIELEGFTFDFVFASSVLQYLSDRDVAVLLGSLRRRVGDDATLYASFPEEYWVPALKSKGNYYRTPEQMLGLVEAAGFTATLGGKSETGFPQGPHLILKPAITGRTV
jgi:SAM-dependent methyltransferase